MKAITHAGDAHADEFIALAIIVAATANGENSIDTIARRDPTQEELDDPDVWVVDVGGVYDPAKRNFDHHGVPGTEGRCAFDLVLEHFQRQVVAAAASPWLAFKSSLDCRGPYATAKEFGMSPESLYATISPIESQILQAFGRAGRLLPGELVYHVLEMVGDGLLSYWEEFRRQQNRAAAGACALEVGDLVFADFRLCGKLSPAVMAAYMDRVGAAGSVTVDDRGEGCENRAALYRHKDHPRVDFTRLTAAETHFVHQNGFLAKTRDGDCNLSRIRELLRAAVIPAEKPPELPPTKSSTVLATRRAHEWLAHYGIASLSFDGPIPQAAAEKIAVVVTEIGGSGAAKAAKWLQKGCRYVEIGNDGGCEEVVLETTIEQLTPGWVPSDGRAAAAAGDTQRFRIGVRQYHATELANSLTAAPVAAAASS